MSGVTKRYLITLALGIACPAIIGLIARVIIESANLKEVAMIGGIMIVGTFVVTAMLVAREKGRSLWYGLARFIAPLLIVVLLLPHSKKRREELMAVRQSAS